MHFFGWKKGLKTGMYYLRTRSAADAIKFTVSASALAEAKAANQTQPTSSVGYTSVPAVSPTKPVASIQDISNGVNKMHVNGNDIMDKTANEELTYEEAVRRREERELENDKLLCSLENPGACAMCSS